MPPIAAPANADRQTSQPGASQPGARQSGVESLRRLVADDMEKVNRAIIEHMQSPVALIPQLAGHIVASGGKRLRPMLTLATAGLCGYTGERHIGLAACVEFIHTATLLHDDVVDESDLRRGKDTANAVWGNQASVLVGDFLFSRAFQLMVGDGSLKVLKILSDASAIIAEGEVHQLVTTNDIATTEDAYLEVIRCKTAQLFAAAAQIGPVVAERPENEELALEGFGRDLGVAFQLVDDVLDRRRGRAGVLEAHDRGSRAERRRPCRGPAPDGQARHARSLARSGPAVRRRGPRRPRRLPGEPVPGRPRGARRLLRRARLLTTAHTGSSRHWLPQRTRAQARSWR